MIKFVATILRPVSEESWTFLRIPSQASLQLPSRGMVSVDGSLNQVPFQATLEPDGEGGHWMKIIPSLLTQANAQVGGQVTIELAPALVEPEPEVPEDFAVALAEAPDKARIIWADITPAARRDWIFWMTSGKKAETRAIRMAKACDMLSKGKRRACCFDRSGMYSKSLSCPIAEGD